MNGRLQTIFDFRRSLRVWISFTFGALALLLTILFGFLLDVSISERVDPQVYNQLQQLTFIYGGVRVVIFLVLGWVIAGRVARPLSEIAAAARRISREGSEEVIPTFPGHDEVASLSRSLNTLVTDLSQQRNALQTAHQELEARVVERTRQLTALYDVLAVSNELERDLPKVLNQALTHMLTAAGTEAGAIHLLSRDETHLKLVTDLNMPPEIVANWQTMPLDHPMVQEILQQEDYLLFSDLTADPCIVPLTALSQNHQVLAFPIRKGRHNLGTLVVILSPSKLLDMTEIGMLSSLADQLAVVVENARLRQEAERLAVMEERNRLARELHDSVTQALYSTTLFAEAGQRQAQAGKMDKALSYLAEVGETSHQALKEMRLLVYKLRPSALDKEGLLAALEQRLKGVEERAGIQYELMVDGELHLPHDVEAALYSMAQETLNNSLKHARATAISVHFAQTDDDVQFEIKDNGEGFVWETAVAAGGLGLTSLQERAKQYKGTVEFQTAPSKGTTVKVWLPIQ